MLITATFDIYFIGDEKKINTIENSLIFKPMACVTK